MPSGIYKRTPLTEEQKAIKAKHMSAIGKKYGAANSPFVSGHKIRVPKESRMIAAAKISLQTKGVPRKKLSYDEKKSRGFLDRKISEETKQKMRIAQNKRVEQGIHHFWKGGRTKLSDLIRKSKIYKHWRVSVFKRDGFKCILCGDKPKLVEADHYPIMFSELMEIYNIQSVNESINCDHFWDINNGRTLCKKCHPKGQRPRKDVIDHFKSKLQP